LVNANRLISIIPPTVANDLVGTSAPGDRQGVGGASPLR